MTVLETIYLCTLILELVLAIIEFILLLQFDIKRVGTKKSLILEMIILAGIVILVVLNIILGFYIDKIQ